MSRRSIDAFDLLRDHLVAAATPARERRGLLRRRRGVVVLLAALVLSGTATATVLSGGEPSAPLTGTLPASATDRYAFSISPSLFPGQLGWCTRVLLRSKGERAAGGGCGPASPAAAAQIAGGAMTDGRGRVLVYAVVDRRVAAVRMQNGRRIVPRADPRLPGGWRGVVAFVSTRQGRASEEMLELTLLDVHGRTISRAPNETAGTRTAGTRTLPARTVDPLHPPGLPCAIRDTGKAHLQHLGQKVVRGKLTRRVDVNARAFRACAAAAFSLGGRRLRAAVLVDARGPAHAPAELPGAAAVAGHPGMVATAGGLTGRRVGRAWLVVDGGTPQQRLSLLRRLRFRTPIV